MSEVGIAGFGAYVPPLRMSRGEVAATHAWLNPGLKSNAESERSVANWDEDAITLAVDAARDCLDNVDRSEIRGVYLGTTTAPFADRLNSGLVAGALGLDEAVVAQDTTGSLRAGTTALVAACAAAREETVLCVAADRRAAPAATVQEMVTGHGGAAVLIAAQAGVARLLGHVSYTVDLVGHFRSAGQEFDYQWEERWFRDEGYLKLVPRLVRTLLVKAGVAPAEIAHFCMPCVFPGVAAMVAQRSGLPDSSVRDNLSAGCGDTGAAHPLLILTTALEVAKPGEKIVVVGFGQGGDALLFEATDAIGSYRERRPGPTKWLARRSQCSYPRYLAINDMIKIGRGLRAEADKGTALTAAYRHRDLLTGLVGGRCKLCDTHQIPRSRVCANPDCCSIDTQEPYQFAESTGRVVSFTTDNLTYTPDPPAYYGMIDFTAGGRLMMDFTNVSKEDLVVGRQMRMVFRVKDRDAIRSYARYFWKATPVQTEESSVG